ncbi:MFS transporter [Formicincola oecophyllae]|nr:MFS transporter [Formicincola oecophyllae]
MTTPTTPQAACEDALYPGLPPGPRMAAMAALLLAVTLSVLDYAIANVALPAIAQDMHATDAQSVWVVNAYQLANLSCLLPCALVGARIGFKRMSQLGLVVFLIAASFCALSHSMAELAWWRTMQGVGGACIMSVNMALVRFIYPGAIVGRGIAMISVATSVGAMAGPSLGALILTFLPWPWLFWFNLPVGLVALLLSWRFLPHIPLRPQHQSIVLGLGLTVAAFATLGIALDGLVRAEWPMALGFGVAALACWRGLVWWQRRKRFFIMPFDLLGKRAFLVPCLVGFLAFVASNLYIVAMPFTLVNVFHRSAGMVGLLVSPWAGGSAVMALLVRKYTDSIQPRRLTTMGLVVVVGGLLGLALLPPTATNWAIVLPTFCAGLGFGVIQASNNRTIMVAAPPGKEGEASGMISVCRLGGQTMGALLVAGVFTLLPQPLAAGQACLYSASFMGAVATLLCLSNRVRPSLA